MANKILIAIIIFLALVVSVFVGFYFYNGASEKTESLSLTLSTEFGDEVSTIKKDNNLREVEIGSTVSFNLSLSQILAETATISCYLYQEMFFGDEEIKFEHTPSEEEKEYLKKMNDFIGGYKITQVIVNIKTINGDEGFCCVLQGADDTKNTMTLITAEGLTTYMGLNQAKKQFFPGSSDSISDCESLTNPDDKNLCLNNLAEKTSNMDLCKFALNLSPKPEEFPYAERFQSCLLFFAEKNKDSSLCELLGDSSRKPFKSECYDYLSFKFCDLSLCDEIPSSISDPQAYPPSLKERCIIRANQREGKC